MAIVGIAKSGFDILKIFPKSIMSSSQLAAQRLTTTGSISMVKQIAGRPNRFGSISNILKKVPAVAGIKGGAGHIAKKFGTQAVIGSGFLFGSTALLSLTQGGQNLVSTAGQGVKDVSNLGLSINKLMSSNPLIPIGLLILGGLVLVTVLKK